MNNFIGKQFFSIERGDDEKTTTMDLDKIYLLD